MTFIVAFLAWYIAIGLLLGAMSLHFDGTDWDDWGSTKAKVRYAIGMLIVSMIAWFPLTLLYIEVKWQQRKARK